MPLPDDHPQRLLINDEVHARPSIPIPTPSRASYLALFTPWGLSKKDWKPLVDLAKRYEVMPPKAGANHYFADFGPFTLRWERHTEFTRYLFVVSGAGDDPFADTAISKIPEDWIAALPGHTINATHVGVRAERELPAGTDDISARFFSGNVLLGSVIAEGLGATLKDFRIRGDGFSRILLLNMGMKDRQTGRMLQRILEIDTYRVLALLSLPVARGLGPFLSESEDELRQVTQLLAQEDGQDEPALLERLTRLQVAMEEKQAATAYRFAAADAYYKLIHQRIRELRESRYPGLQNLQEFTERRLAPAINTCQAMNARQSSLGERAARATQLLSTRVDIDRQQQNQAVLATMNRRALLQLRLQQTVEGLSVAAITYYIVGLVGYAAKGLKEAGVPLNTDVTVGLSIPVIALLIGLGVRRVRKSLAKPEYGGEV